MQLIHYLFTNDWMKNELKNTGSVTAFKVTTTLRRLNNSDLDRNVPGSSS